MRTRTKRIVALLAGTVQQVCFASFAVTDVAANDLAYKGELEIMHYSTSEESEGNGGSDGFRTVLQAWDEAHPDITLTQNVSGKRAVQSQIAGVGDLPDVFLLQGMNTKDWAKQGLLLDLTDYIKASPYYDEYIQNSLHTVTDGDSLYATRY